MAQHPHGKPAPMEMSHIANQISTMSVAPAAEPQKREIVAKLNELASQMKHWAVQVEGFASLLNSFSIISGQGQPHSHPPESSSDGAQYAPRGAPNGQGGFPPYPGPSQQPPQQYSGSQHYQFHVQQYQGRHPDGASPHSYPPGTASQPQPQPETSPSLLTTSIVDGNERPGKRRRKTDTQRRKKDPLAPKRPPSAYILYQNDVRKQMQDKYSELPYSDVLGKISESWQTLEESKKKVYLDMVERDKVRYEDEKLRYNMGHDIPTKPTPRRPLSALRAPSEPEIDAEVEGEEGTEAADQDDQEPEAKRTRLGGPGETPADAPAGHSPSYLQLQSQAAMSPAQHLEPHARNPSRQPTPQSMPPPRPPSQASHSSASASLAAHQSPRLPHISPQASPRQTPLQVLSPGPSISRSTPDVGTGVSSEDESGVGKPAQAPSQP
ncbi:hypothetical protein FRC10_002461 [Ceratobasidium sp. 414]|nr:hypothetical protein FRC10_002461 [Ceratobasidium sp. 414]